MRTTAFALAALAAGCGFEVSGAAEPPPVDASPPPDTRPDAPGPDAPDDPTPMWRVVETIQVRCVSETPVVTTTVILLDEAFRVRASGECYANGVGMRTDAEWAAYNTLGGRFDGQDDVDIGLGINYDGSGQKNPRWGAYRSDHIYEAMLVGAGAPLRVRFVDPNMGNNSGSLSLEILRLR